MSMVRLYLLSKINNTKTKTQYKKALMKIISMNPMTLTCTSVVPDKARATNHCEQNNRITSSENEAATTTITASTTITRAHRCQMNTKTTLICTLLFKRVLALEQMRLKSMFRQSGKKKETRNVQKIHSTQTKSLVANISKTALEEN